MKYYWPDFTENILKSSINFRLPNDSLLILKLLKNNFFIQKPIEIQKKYLQLKSKNN